MYAHEFDLYWPDANNPTHEIEVAVRYASPTVGSVIKADVLSVWELSEAEAPRRLTPEEHTAFVLANPGLEAHAIEESADRACSAAEQATENGGWRLSLIVHWNGGHRTCVSFG
jgi:hypothetical protein